MVDNMPDLTSDDVRSAYEVFLRRTPESDAAVQRHVGRSPTKDDFRRTMLAAKEFYDKNYAEIARYVISSCPISASLDIEVHVGEKQLKLLFDHIQEVWSKLGRSDPHFSVLSLQKFRSEAIGANKADFYDSGRGEVETTFRRLAALGLHPSKEGTAVELGCGVGRVTRYLGERFSKVIGYDISASHISLAAAYVTEVGQTNVTVQQLVSAESANFAKHDFFYSRLVLQHNPPPVIAYLLDVVLSNTRPGGIVVFQLMTARAGYTFDTESYVAKMASLDDQELHVLPQSEVFELFAKHGILCVETFRDVALKGFDRTSMTFIGRRKA